MKENQEIQYLRERIEEEENVLYYALNMQYDQEFIDATREHLEMLKRVLQKLSKM